MWRFTRTNSIAEGFYNGMVTITRRACGFRDFFKLQTFGYRYYVVDLVWDRGCFPVFGVQSKTRGKAREKCHLTISSSLSTSWMRINARTISPMDSAPGVQYAIPAWATPSLSSPR